MRDYHRIPRYNTSLMHFINKKKKSGLFKNTSLRECRYQYHPRYHIPSWHQFKCKICFLSTTSFCIHCNKSLSYLNRGLYAILFVYAWSYSPVQRYFGSEQSPKTCGKGVNSSNTTGISLIWLNHIKASHSSPNWATPLIKEVHKTALYSLKLQTPPCIFYTSTFSVDINQATAHENI